MTKKIDSVIYPKSEVGDYVLLFKNYLQGGDKENFLQKKIVGLKIKRIKFDIFNKVELMVFNLQE